MGLTLGGGIVVGGVVFTCCDVTTVYFARLTLGLIGCCLSVINSCFNSGVMPPGLERTSSSKAYNDILTGLTYSPFLI